MLVIEIHYSYLHREHGMFNHVAAQPTLLKLSFILKLVLHYEKVKFCCTLSSGSYSFLVPIAKYESIDLVL